MPEAAFIYAVVAINTWVYLWYENQEKRVRGQAALFVLSFAWPLVWGGKLWEKWRA